MKKGIAISITIFSALIIFVLVTIMVVEPPKIEVTSTPEPELVIELTVIVPKPALIPSIAERLEEADINSLLMQKVLRIERLLEALLDQQCEEISAEPLTELMPSGIKIKMMED